MAPGLVNYVSLQEMVKWVCIAIGCVNSPGSGTRKAESRNLESTFLPSLYM